MACLWSGYIKSKADISELVKFAGGAQFDRIEVITEEFRDLAEAVTRLEDYIARKSWSWVAVFSK